MKIEEKKKTGPKGKVGEGLAGWMRPCICMIRMTVLCGAPLYLLVLLKKGNILCA